MFHSDLQRVPNQYMQISPNCSGGAQDPDLKSYEPHLEVQKKNYHSRYMALKNSLRLRTCRWTLPTCLFLKRVKLCLWRMCASRQRGRPRAAQSDRLNSLRDNDSF